MKPYSKTYTDLQDFTDYIFSYSSELEYKENSPLKILVKSFLSSESFRAFIGIQFLYSTPEKAVLEFRSNRFFIDAVRLKVLPGLEDIKMACSTVCSELQNYGFKVRPSDFQNIFTELSSKRLERSLPEIFSGHRIPEPSRQQLEFLDEYGYLIIEDAIPEHVCDYAAEVMSDLARLERNTSGGGYLYGSGKMQRVYSLIGKHKIFQDLLMHPTSHQVMSHMFHRNTFHDKYFLTSFHGNILSEGAESQIWHIDANVPDPVPTWIIRSNSNYIIHDYTNENGATEIIPGSHRWCKKPTVDEVNSNIDQAIKMVAPKGSIVFWHGHLWHRSGENLSNTSRTALLAAYSASFFREVCMEENPYLNISGYVQNNLNDKVKRLIGWEHGVKDYS